MENQIIRVSNLLNKATSTEEVVRIINNNGLEANLSDDELTSFDENMTKEELAAQYAYNAMMDSDYQEEENIEAHLEILKEEGANFDFSTALENAKLRFNKKV